MKQFVLGLSVSFAFIAGCIAATIAQSSAVPSARATPQGVTRWEYQCTNAWKSAVDEFNVLGAQGWELVGSDASCFKRPLD